MPEPPNLILSMQLFHKVEESITEILGMTGDKEQEHRFLKPTELNKQRAHSCHSVVLVLSGAEVHDKDLMFRRVALHLHCSNCHDTESLLLQCAFKSFSSHLAMVCDLLCRVPTDVMGVKKEKKTFFITVQFTQDTKCLVHNFVIT